MGEPHDAVAVHLQETIAHDPLEVRVEQSREKAADEQQLAPDESTTKSFWRWFEVGVFSLFVLSGQAAATICGRLYYEKGGESKWMATLVQVVGFPILIPLLFISPSNSNNDDTSSPPPSSLVLAAWYIFMGIFLAITCMLFSIGLLDLPVSTFSLLAASQLGFIAFFSFFLNSLKFTAPIINSIVLLTTSSILLVFQTDSENSAGSSKGKFIIGFLCTIGAAALYALFLSLTQVFFKKVHKGETFRKVLDLLIYESLVATIVIVMGLFASSEWKSLKGEMEGFKLGKTSYVLTLVWTALTWQLFGLGLMGLIFKVSALFGNVISTLGLPIVPVLAVFIFNDKMSGVKAVSLLLAIWGFVSYIYNHYHLENLKLLTSNGDDTNVVNGGSEISLVESGN